MIPNIIIYDNAKLTIKNRLNTKNSYRCADRKNCIALFHFSLQNLSNSLIENIKPLKIVKNYLGLCKFMKNKYEEKNENTLSKMK